MVERASSSAPATAAGEMQAPARVSVMDRLGPMPAQKRERERSAERGSSRRGRKLSKKAQEPRVPVHERLGPLQPQAFKKNELFQKRNRQQVWRHQGEEVWRPQVYTREKEQEKEQASVEEVENAKPEFVKAPPPLPVVKPVAKPFNVEQHRQAWTWKRPTADAAAAMETDE